jgi:hypothetical protein
VLRRPVVETLRSAAQEWRQSMAKSKSLRASDAALLCELREFGLAYPGAHTKSPWPGHIDLAVKDKTFAYLGIEGEPVSISLLQARQLVVGAGPSSCPTPNRRLRLGKASGGHRELAADGRLRAFRSRRLQGLDRRSSSLRAGTENARRRACSADG